MLTQQRARESSSRLLDVAARAAWSTCCASGPGRATWRALAGSIWPRLARSGCPGRPGCLDLSALVAPGRRGWLNLAALGALARPGWLDLAARSALACLGLLDLAVLNSFARAAWLDLNANDGPNA